MKSSAEEIHLPRGVTLTVYCSHCVHDNTHSTCIASRPKWIPQAVQNQDNNVFGQGSSLVCRVQWNGFEICHVCHMIILTTTACDGLRLASFTKVIPSMCLGHLNFMKWKMRVGKFNWPWLHYDSFSLLEDVIYIYMDSYHFEESL